MLSFLTTPFHQYAGTPIRGVGFWDPSNPPTTTAKTPRHRPFTATERCRPGETHVFEGQFAMPSFQEQAAVLKPAVERLCQTQRVKKVFVEAGSTTYGAVPIRNGVAITWRDPASRDHHKALVYTRNGDINFVTADGFKAPKNTKQATKAIHDAVFELLLQNIFTGL